MCFGPPGVSFSQSYFRYDNPSEMGRVGLVSPGTLWRERIERDEEGFLLSITPELIAHVHTPRQPGEPWK